MNLDERIEMMLQSVGLNKDHISRFPHEFSGGQRQRIGIARALSVNPKFIVCDELISTRDVSIQTQVLNMLKKLINEPAAIVAAGSKLFSFFVKLNI